MDANELVGSWLAESGYANVEFRADGTYIRVSSFEMPMTFETLAIDEEGTYAINDDIVTFTATSGHYRRNGVDEGFDLKVVDQSVRLESNADQTGYDLILSDSVWRRQPAA